MSKCIIVAFEINYTLTAEIEYMKLRAYNTLFLLGILFTSSAFAHPIKLTSSLLEYDQEKKNITLKCRVFIDDFINTLNKKDFNASDLSKEDIAEVECYFWESYRITVNDVQLALNYEVSRAHLKNNVLDLKFSIDDLTINEGDKILIENVLFFTKFGILQSNKMIVRIPPFITEDHFETRLREYGVYYEL